GAQHPPRKSCNALGGGAVGPLRGTQLAFDAHEGAEQRAWREVHVAGTQQAREEPGGSDFAPCVWSFDHRMVRVPGKPWSGEHVERERVEAKAPPTQEDELEGGVGDRASSARARSIVGCAPPRGDEPVPEPDTTQRSQAVADLTIAQMRSGESGDLETQGLVPPGMGFVPQGIFAQQQ